MATEISLLSVLRGLLCVSSLPVSANGITEAPSPAPRKAGLEPGRSSAKKMWARGKKRAKKRPPVAPLPQPQPPRFLEPGHSRLDLQRCPSGLPERRLGEVLTRFCQQPGGPALPDPSPSPCAEGGQRLPWGCCAQNRLPGLRPALPPSTQGCAFWEPPGRRVVRCPAPAVSQDDQQVCNLNT